jgi:hypothetical protein
MPTKAEIARHLGFSRAYITQLVKRGMPTDSFSNAKDWKNAHASSRASTSPKQIAKQIASERDDDSSEAQRCQILVPFAAARDMAWRGYDAILDFVLELPKNVAAQCNPSNPQIALAALESECTGILCDAYEVYTAWSKVRLPLFSARNLG